jgi:Flp pilus assembly protein CpaB
MGRRAIVLLVALILAGLAAWAVWNFLQGVQADAQAGQEIANVFVAGPDGIDEGTEGSILVSAYDSDARCSDEELDIAEAANCPIKKDTDQAEDVPDGAFQEENEIREFLRGRVAAGPIAPKSVLTRAQWTEVTVDVIPLSEQIPSGKQALTISTGNVQGVNGFIEAGDRLNMIISLSIPLDLIPLDLEGVPLPDDVVLPGEPDETATTGEEAPAEVFQYTRYVLQGIPVLAAGRDVRPDEDDETIDVTGTTVPGAEGAPAEDTGNSTVFTLEVTPDQAERIVYAFQNGSIWLTLVPPDFVEVETDGVVLNNLFGGDLVESIFDILDESN